MNAKTERVLMDGAAGPIEVALDLPDATMHGLAVIAHPHPLFGGTLENKVVQTLARAFVSLGYVAARPNFRGVGRSGGVHDEGRGETEDLVQVVDALEARFSAQRIVLAGFSFGSFVQTHVAARRAARGVPVQRLVLVGTAASQWEVLPVPADTIVIHGEKDDTVPLSAVLDWARPQDLPVIVIPGADHFFHRKLVPIKRIVVGAWRGEQAEFSTDGAERD